VDRGFFKIFGADRPLWIGFEIFAIRLRSAGVPMRSSQSAVKPVQHGSGPDSKPDVAPRQSGTSPAPVWSFRSQSGSSPTRLQANPTPVRPLSNRSDSSPAPFRCQSGSNPAPIRSHSGSRPDLLRPLRSQFGPIRSHGPFGPNPVRAARDPQARFGDLKEGLFASLCAFATWGFITVLSALLESTTASRGGTASSCTLGAP
jgi:hypothetical protein